MAGSVVYIRLILAVQIETAPTCRSRCIAVPEVPVAELKPAKS